MNIIVTGASKGIGFETVRHFATIGHHKIVAIARTEAKLQELKKTCQDANTTAEVYPIVFDLKNNELYETVLLPSIKKCFVEVDVLINNAGLLINKPFEKLSSIEINSMLQLNFTAPVQLIQCLLPIMRKNCHVVNISSMGGFQGSQKFPGLAIYSAAKAGLASLTECLAEEYRGRGISFNCLAIGATDTEMLREAFPGYKPPFSATDMAEFIVDFALTKHKFFNGKIIPVTISTP